ncbi:putative ribonuclease H-like domain-containing protein, partial [Tanacetum coccineum]
QDYALRDVIENGNSFKPVARVTANADGTFTSTIPCLVTIEEKAQKKNDVKARSMLLMALPNEHLLTFSQYKDAKTLFEAIQARFGGNDATKKTQKTLLKKMYENFNVLSTESLDSIFNMLQENCKLVGRLGFDDLYNNFKIVEQEVKRFVTSSSNSSLQNMTFVSNPSSTNEVNTANIQVSTASTPVTTASLHDNTANLSDAIVYPFLANQPKWSQLVHEDLEQIHKDDLEEMGLKWQLALLSMRAIREYRSLRNQESRPRNQDSSRNTVNVEETSSKAMIAINGAGFDWSLMVEEEVPTNMALMAFSESKVHNDKTCSNTCLKSYKILKKQYVDLRIEFNKFEFDLATYKRGLSSVEEQLVFYKKNEVIFSDQIAILKRDASFKDSKINALKIQLDKLKKEKESYQIKIDKFENAFKSLDKLTGSQISDNSRKGVGFESYNAVTPLPTGLFAPPTIDLSNYGLEEFQQPEFEGYEVKVNKSVSENSSNEDPIIEEWVSDSDEDDSEEMVVKSDKVQHKPEQIYEPRNSRTNWNEKKTQKLGVGFQVTKKVCFVAQKGTSQREVRPVWNNAMRTTHQNFSNSRRHCAPTAVLTKSGLVPINTARQSFSRAAVLVSTARPINTDATKSFVNVTKPRPNVFQKTHSQSRRPFYQQTTLKNINLNNKVNTAKANSVNTAKGYRVKSVVGKQGFNAVKSSACWVWRPIGKVINHGDPQVALKDTRIFDSGCSRHMTRNKSYLTNYQDYDGGFVAFAGSSKGGKITGKGKIRTGKLDFEDVYFVKELKFNLFSVLQMRDRKNSVLCTESECLILFPEFKLPDESQVMLKIPRKDNMYSFDLKNVVPSKGLTCLIAKATNDESKLLHRRLGHINFKTLNKLVKGNLVRGLPSKIFENDHTCVACQKGKQHKASCKKDETSGILKDFTTRIENQLNYKVKIIRCDNGTEFKNYEMNQFCRIKAIKREFSNARTPQQNGVAKRKIRTLIEAARTMLADSLLRIPFWAEAVNTACYVQNRVLVTKPHNKTPYELLIGRTPIISFMRPFGCPITILSTLDHLGKFDGKANEGFLVGLGTNSDAGQAGKEKVPDQEYILLPLLHTSSNVFSISGEAEYSPKDDAIKKNGVKDPAKEGDMNGPREATHTNRNEFESRFRQDKDDNNTYRVFTPVNACTHSMIFYPIDPLMSDLEDTVNLQDTGIFGNAYDNEDVGAEADINNLETTMSVSPIPTTIIHKDHPKAQIIREVDSAVQTRRMHKQNEAGSYAGRASLVQATKCLDTGGFTTWKEGHWIEAIRLFLAYASYMDFTVYQMDVKSAFLYGTIEEEVYVSNLQVLYIRNFLIECTRWRKHYMVFIKFLELVRTPMETHKPLSKDADGTDVDVHLYRSMIGSLMYLTSSRPDIMFAVCACSRFQVQPKASHMHAVKRIFRYLNGEPTLGLWYPKDSLMDLIAYSDSNYVGASLDRKSTTKGCQFLGYRLISWQCKKQIIVANSTTKAEYIAASNCCGEHNMVAFLQKPTGSEEFHQIVDFLPGSHIRYALTANPTIYVSLIEQFWQTVTVETINEGEQQLIVTVDGQTFAITEASVRRHL